jgi:hypothetical protein
MFPAAWAGDPASMALSPELLSMRFASAVPIDLWDHISLHGPDYDRVDAREAHRNENDFAVGLTGHLLQRLELTDLDGGGRRQDVGGCKHSERCRTIKRARRPSRMRRAESTSLYAIMSKSGEG